MPCTNLSFSLYVSEIFFLAILFIFVFVVVIEHLLSSLRGNTISKVLFIKRLFSVEMLFCQDDGLFNFQFFFTILYSEVYSKSQVLMPKYPTSSFVTINRLQVPTHTFQITFQNCLKISLGIPIISLVIFSLTTPTILIVPLSKLLLASRKTKNRREEVNLDFIKHARDTKGPIT